MTAPATLPHPTQSSAGTSSTASTSSPRYPQRSGGSGSAFAQLLRGQADEAPRASDATPAGNASTAEADASTTTPQERERKPAAADDSPNAALPPPAQATVPADTAPPVPSTMAWAGLASAPTGTVGGAAQGDATTTSGANDPLSALRDAGGHGAAQRKHGLADERIAERDSRAAANPPADASARQASFAHALGEASADNAAVAKPLPVADVPAADGALPSLGAVTDPAAAMVAPAAHAEAAVPMAQASLTASPGTPAFVPSLGLQLSTWLKDGVQHASLELHPQDLGPIDIRIAVKDGQTHIDLVADVAGTRQALGDALPQLTAALGDVGLSLSGGGVADPSAQGQRDGRGEQGGRSAARSANATNANNLVGDAAASAQGRAPASARQHRSLLDLYA